MAASVKPSVPNAPPIGVARSCIQPDPTQDIVRSERAASVGTADCRLPRYRQTSAFAAAPRRRRSACDVSKGPSTTTAPSGACTTSSDLLRAHDPRAHAALAAECSVCRFRKQPPSRSISGAGCSRVISPSRAGRLQVLRRRPYSVWAAVSVGEGRLQRVHTSLRVGASGEVAALTWVLRVPPARPTRSPSSTTS